MAKRTTKTFLREVKNGMVSDSFYIAENQENKLMTDYENSAADKVMIMMKDGKTEICLFYRDHEFSFCLGQSVRIKTEWCENENERNVVFTIAEIDERLKRAIIRDEFSDDIIKKCERVEFGMIEKA